MQRHFRQRHYADEPPAYPQVVAIVLGCTGRQYAIYILPCLTRRYEVVLIGLHISHTFLTHYFKTILKSEPRPECVPCHCPLTVKHLL